MRHLGLLIVLFLALPLAACDDRGPVSPDQVLLDQILLDQISAFEGASVFNRGNGQPSFTSPCGYAGFQTTDATSILAPNGVHMLSCKFSDLPPIDRVQHNKNWMCFMPNGEITFDSHWVRTPSGSRTVVKICDSGTAKPRG